MTATTVPTATERTAVDPDDLYNQLDSAGRQVMMLGDSWSHANDLAPGLYLTDPQGHALLVGVNGRAMTLIDFGPAMADLGSVQVTSPEVLEQLADRLRFMAARLRRRSAGGAA